MTSLTEMFRELDPKQYLPDLTLRMGLFSYDFMVKTFEETADKIEALYPDEPRRAEGFRVIARYYQGVAGRAMKEPVRPAACGN